MRCRVLAKEEIDRSLFSGFIRRQEVGKCWRKEGGAWVIRDAPFIDDWSEEDYRRLICQLRRTARAGGLVCAAFCGGILKGFVSVEPERFGPEGDYMDLAHIHVSADLRGNGIGRALFLTAVDWARARGAGKLYISAHSAVESQAFYRAMGCTEARIYSPRHVEKEPFDCQLEYSLQAGMADGGETTEEGQRYV